MELELNETSIMSGFMNMIKKEAKKFESNSGEIEFLISNDLLERAIAEEELFREIEKGDWSLKNEQRHSIEDFQKRYGLI